MAQPSMPQQAQGHADNDIKVGTRIESENTAVIRFLVRKLRIQANDTQPRDNLSLRPADALN